MVSSSNNIFYLIFNKENVRLRICNTLKWWPLKIVENDFDELIIVIKVKMKTRFVKGKKYLN